MRSVLQRGPLRERLVWRAPHEASLEELSCVHDTAYLREVHATSAAGGRRYGVSTVLPAGGWLGVSLAAGAALDAADAVLSGSAQRALCLVRPPGHHASRAACDGYCFVNNCALAAQRAVAAGHRVAILDIDVHHGNGTQSIFYDRSDVLTVSMHQNMGQWEEGTSHPETGFVDEVGAADGVGFNVNVPLDLGSGDAAHLSAFQSIIVPAVDAFQPSFIVVALGVDGSQFDPNGRQALTMAGYRDLARACRQLADRHAHGRMVLTLEGGYALSYAAFCLHAAVEGALNADALLPDPFLGTYPDPPISDPNNWRLATQLARMKGDRADAIAQASKDGQSGA